jgi:hypothetical protein
MKYPNKFYYRRPKERIEYLRVNTDPDCPGNIKRKENLNVTIQLGKNNIDSQPV